MKKLAVSTFLIFSFCLAIFGQTNKIRSNKIAVINSDRFFEEKTGIKEFVDAYLKIKEQQKFRQIELDNILIKTKALKKELETVQNNPILFQNKIEEVEKLQREYNFRSEEIASLPEKRKLELMRVLKIREALIQFKKEKGYAIILDESMLNIFSIIIEENEFPAPITSEFIEFYNKNYVKTNLR